MTTIKTKINSQPQRPLLLLPFIVTLFPCSQALNPGDHYSILSRCFVISRMWAAPGVRALQTGFPPRRMPETQDSCTCPQRALSLRRAGLRADRCPHLLKELGCFQLQATAHKDATNRFYVEGRSTPRVQARGHMIGICLVLEETTTIFQSSCAILYPFLNVWEISKHFQEMQNIYGYSILFKQLPADSYIGNFNFVIRAQWLYLYAHKNFTCRSQKFLELGHRVQIF